MHTKKCYIAHFHAKFISLSKKSMKPISREQSSEKEKNIYDSAVIHYHPSLSLLIFIRNEVT